MDSNVALVIDNGSGLVKAGLVTVGEPIDDSPACVFPSIVGRPKPTLHYLDKSKIQDYYVGDEAQELRAQLDLNYVLKHGVVQDWNDMVLIWEHTFSHEAIDVDSSEVPVMLTEAPMNPKANREKMAEYMFEHFGVPKLSIQVQGELTLCASGRSTGLVLDCGDGVCHSIPVINTGVKTTAVERVDVAGHDITEYMARILKDQGVNLHTDAGLEIVRNMKEKLTYVALNYDEELAAYKADPSKVDEKYALPNGQVITVGIERFKAPEILFNPNLIGMDAKYSIQKLCLESIKRLYEPELHIPMLENVVLSGGTTMIKGFAERLQKELNALAPKELNNAAIEVRVIAAPDRQNQVWRGGATKASMASFDEWITAADYQEDPDIIHKRR